MRRGVLAALLVCVVLFPSGEAGVASRSCRTGGCPTRGHVLWVRQLTGSWIAENGIEGTVYGHGQAYAAVGHGVAAIGFGTTVAAFNEATGVPLWTVSLSEPTGSQVVAVDTWPGVVTVGVAIPPSGPRPGAAPVRREVVLATGTGEQIGAYQAVGYGGAVAASPRRTVIVGATSVTGYANGSGAPIWRDPTGPAEQAWTEDGGLLYITVSAHGVLSTAPVTAVRQINLRTGAERLIEPAGGSFDGSLSGVADGDLLFTGPAGLAMYRATTGQLIAQRAGAAVEGIDPVRHVLYADTARALIGIDLTTGKNEPGGAVSGPLRTYGVRDGVALGLDQGAAGAAWGYSIAKRHVIWTTRSLPWPHYFVDPTGLGGSADPASGVVVLVACRRVGQAVPASPPLPGGLACRRPMLVAIDR